MPTHRVHLVLGAFLVSFGAAFVAAAAAPASVSGSMTVNGKKVPLVKIYVDESPDDIIVLLAAKDVPADVVPFVGEEVARKEKIYAVALTISRKDRAITAGFNGIFYPGPDMGYAGLAIENAKLDLKRFDATVIEGRAFTPKPVVLSDLTYDFDVSFSLPLGSSAPPAPIPAVLVSGDESAPAKAFADYYRAGFSGDAAAIGSFMAAARRKEFDAAEPEKRAMMLDLFKMQPAQIRIVKATTKGGTATLAVEGLNETAAKTTGEITMLLEGGAWKVEREKWTSTNK